MALLAIFIFLCGLLFCEGSCPPDYCCNGGSCNITSTPSSFFCDCPDGFSGSQCENDQYFCKETCTYGTCVQGEGMTTACLCPSECCTSCEDVCNAITCLNSTDLLCQNAIVMDDCTCQTCYDGSADYFAGGECSFYTVTSMSSSSTSSTLSTVTTVRVTTSFTPSTTSEPEGLTTSLTPSATSEPEGLSPAVKAVIAVNVIISLVLLTGLVLVIVYLGNKWLKVKVAVAPGSKNLLQEESIPEEDIPSGVHRKGEKQVEVLQSTQDTPL